MSQSRNHLRNRLDRAKTAYEAASYPGNLALDVLGPGTRSSGRSSSRGFAPLAIAAALAIGLGAGMFAGRLFPSASSTPSIALKTSIDSAQTSVMAPQVAPATPTVEVASAASTTARDTAFTVVPKSSSFAGQDVSVVPDLSTLAPNDATGGSSSSSSALSPASSLAFAPMSLMMLSASEYDEQQAAADAAAKSKSSGTATSSEDRS